MKSISLFQGIFYGVLIAAALIGLFVFATYESKGGAGAVGSVTVWGTLPEADVQGALLEVVKLDNSMKSVHYVEKPAATLPSDLSAAIATGNPPDLVLASQEELVSLEPFLQQIPVSTLSARTFADTFVHGGQIYASSDSKGYWGVPLLVDSMVLFYNRSILSSSGVVSPPATWEALTGLVSQVATYTATKQITRGLIALGTYANTHDARGVLSTLFIQTSVPVTTVDSGLLKADLGRTSSGAASGAPGEAVVRFYTQFADPSKTSYTWNASLPDSQAAFGRGDLGMYLGYVSEARFLKQAAPNLDFDVRPVPQPATAAGKATYGLIYAAMIPRGTLNAAGGYKAAVILADTPEQQALAEATGLAPATQAALSGSDTSADPTASVARRSALYASGWLSPTPASTDEVFGAMINDVVTGRSEIPEALSTAEQSLGALLAQ